MVIKVQQRMDLLPIFIFMAFPVLYNGGQSSNSLCSIVGIILLFLGLSGPLIKRIIGKERLHKKTTRNHIYLFKKDK